MRDSTHTGVPLVGVPADEWIQGFYAVLPRLLSLLVLSLEKVANYAIEKT